MSTNRPTTHARTDPRRMHRAAVLQRCRPRRGALESQARAQGREGSVQNTRGRPRRARARHDAHDAAVAADGGVAKQDWRGAGDTRKACSRRRQSSPTMARPEGCADGPAGRGRRPGEEGNRAREGRRCSPCKELSRGSPERPNRGGGRRRELGPAALMEKGKSRVRV